MSRIPDLHDLGGYLREQRESAQLSLRQAAKAAGISNPYLSQIERGLRRPSAEILQQIAKGLRISAEQLYVRAGILEETERGATEPAEETAGATKSTTDAMAKVAEKAVDAATDTAAKTGN